MCENEEEDDVKENKKKRATTDSRKLSCVPIFARTSAHTYAAGVERRIEWAGDGGERKR